MTEGVRLVTGPRGGKYYESGSKRIYVKEPGSAEYEMRRSAQPTTGWHQMYPKKGPERARVYEECGADCFLQPNEESPGHSGFPICPACRDGPCSCEKNCKGIIAAGVRAHQWGYDSVAQRVDKLKKKYQCEQKGGEDDDDENEDENLPGLLYEKSRRFSQAYCPQPPPCPADKPLQYKMRGRNEKCCRAKPIRRQGPRAESAWITFMRQHKGQGLTVEQLSQLYRAAK